MMHHDRDRSLNEAIYRQLSDQLLHGELLPDERLKIRELAATMGTSVTPVRDALLRLVHEDALYLKGPRDIRVRALTVQEYLEMREIRLDLEGDAAAAAAERATADDIRGLECLIRENKRALKANNRVLTTTLNQRFHFEILRIACMPVRSEILRRLWLRLGPWLAQNYAMTSHAMVAFHIQLVAALHARDAEAARSAMRRDLLQAGGEILAKAGTQPAGNVQPSPPRAAGPRKPARP